MRSRSVQRIDLQDPVNTANQPIVPIAIPPKSVSLIDPQRPNILLGYGVQRLEARESWKRVLLLVDLEDPTVLSSYPLNREIDEKIKQLKGRVIGHRSLVPHPRRIPETSLLPDGLTERILGRKTAGFEPFRWMLF